MIKLDLWDIINARAPQQRYDIADSLEKPENVIGQQGEAEEAKDSGNAPATDTAECGNRG